MKKITKDMLIISIIILAIVFLTIYYKQDWISKLKIVNEKNYREIITKKYSDKKLEKINNEINNNLISSSKKLNASIKLRNIKVECLRKTNNFYYIMLLSTSNKKLFIIIDESYDIYSSFIIKDFKSENEILNNIKINETNFREIKQIDENTIYAPVSFTNFSGHITKEGTIILEYQRQNDSNISSILKEIKVYSNKEILETSESSFMSFIPIILPDDKLWWKMKTKI